MMKNAVTGCNRFQIKTKQLIYMPEQRNYTNVSYEARMIFRTYLDAILLSQHTHTTSRIIIIKLPRNEGYVTFTVDVVP